MAMVSIAVRIDVPHDDHTHGGTTRVETLRINSDTLVREATESLMRDIGYTKEENVRVGLVFQGAVCDEDKTFADFGIDRSFIRMVRKRRLLSTHTVLSCGDVMFQC